MKLYVTYLKIQKTIEKNLLLAESLEKRLNARAGTKPPLYSYSNIIDEEQKTAKPEEIVRVYETLFQVIS